MEENWATIEEFPTYSVSDLGRVANRDTGRILRESKTYTGLVKIGLMIDGVQHARGVALLVAEAFVEGRSHEFNTPIHLDGNSTNNRADNLVWRPRWFALKYSRQFTTTSVHNQRGPIVDVDTGVWYTDMFEVATTFGLLVDDIRRGINGKQPIFPTWQLFSFS